MSQRPDTDRAPGRTAGARAYLRQAFLTGLAVTVPLLATLFVLVFALDVLAGLLDPVVGLLEGTVGFADPFARLLLQVSTVLALAGVVLAVGVVAESRYGSGRIEPRVEAVITSIPGLGSVYESLDEMSQVLLRQDTQSFEEVKLVEYPGPGSYTIAFLTAEPGEAVRSATGHQEMVSLFMPMAPNPFMGGFVLHVAADQVHDVDMTVEEGVRAVVSSGVAVDDRFDDGSGHPDGATGAGHAPGPGVRPRDGHDDRAEGGGRDGGRSGPPGGRL